MTNTLFSITDAARLLGGIPEHKINYAHRIGALSDATHRVGGIRVYTEDDLRRMAEYFGVSVRVPVQEGERHG